MHPKGIPPIQRKRFDVAARIGIVAFFSKFLKETFFPRPLKKAQVQGGVTHPDGWVPGPE